MKRNIISRLALLAPLAVHLSVGDVRAQGVTTGWISGVVVDASQAPLPGATVEALHEPSGTRYEAVTRADGRFSIPGMRVGGPYRVTARLAGFQDQSRKDVVVNLGVATDVALTLSNVAVSEEITVTAESSEVFSSGRTGAATTVDRETIATLPTVTDRINDFARLTPQYTGGPLGGSFVGQDNRYNNITVDGSYFNNSFGLGGQPGDRTGVSPIASAAIEEIQVNVAPYDVRQGNFVGAGVNMVTRSGTNTYRGSAYYWFRDNDLVGTEAKGLAYNPGTFDARRYGAWVSGPILKDRLFFFGSIEDDKLTQPGTTFRANQGGETVGGNVTRVRASDLDALSSYLNSNFQYQTGPYQDYDFATPAKRYLAKLDYNLSARHKVSLRYTQLDSKTDVLLSNSSSLGFGSRRTSTTGLNFDNSNYAILENIKSGVAEWNAILSSTMANSLIVGYTSQDESRESRGSFFPLVDVLEGGSVYTTFGFEPFTPNNELRYKTFQIQDNFTWNRGRHTLTFGATAQRYESENVFFPGSQSVYVYNSLADFYADANGFLANPNRTTSPVTLRRFQVRWNNIPGQEKPIQPLEVWYTGLYAQDEFEATRRLRITYGLRLDVPFFGETGFQNANADALTFRDESGAPVQYETEKLPGSNVLWSPRVGFNWDLTGDRNAQLRGGTGVFTGPPAYVWISNQVGNTGVLTGFASVDNTTTRPFNPNPDAYKPATVTGAPASSYELALTDTDFKFPQTWRSNLAFDKKLPFGLIGTAEFLYNRDVNGVYYINANLPAAQSSFAGADTRSRYTSNRIHSNVSNAVVLKNQDVGRSWTVSASLQKSLPRGFLRTAYTYFDAKNTVDPGSIAFGSWSGNQISGDPNNPGLAYSGRGHRFFLAGSYRLEYRNFGATTFSLFWEGRSLGTASYTFSGDLNGDGGTNNDLIYVPRDASEMNFQTFTQGGRTFTAAEQTAAWEAYIQADSYLRGRRGQYAERNGVLLPMVWRADFSVAQDLFKNLGGGRHSLQFRVDILNVGNLVNSDWGVGQRLVGSTTSPPISAQPLIQAGADATGRAQYRLRVLNNQLVTTPLEFSAGEQDVYRVQFSLRYSFN
jgi:hypothetical protein